ncbi:methylmalonate-semialdehyde dehydrogenase [acylating], mitochondrial-like isoform X2 [Mercurialis annua]|uniref:methylmalonate-semialdehyde dehydrogenase [acylating], mitochondrial-like isoform X2 n=1 Tax=Mercurialis annua TaxID=3986 RepID=UPI00215F2E49|nr:methylmalonate-semialdehyde dehydrogenase [acylating], mitochondrial-like isoform X2 [Mercurialis annua]
MEMQSQMEYPEQNQMLPPEPGNFQDREELIKYVRDFGANQGYVVTIKKSRRDRRVILGCDRGGVYRNRRKIEETQRKRKASSRLINCPFEAIGKKEDDVWVLSVRNGDHNHEPLKDMSEHPYSRRFTEEEVRQIKMMTEAGVKPLQVLKNLKQSNPELLSTPRHLYNLKAKIRQGNLPEKIVNSWRPTRSIPVNVNSTSVGGSSKQNNQPLKVPNFIGGKFVESKGSTIIDVLNPASQEVVSQLLLTTYEEFKDAVIAAKKAFPLWKNTPVGTRQRIMFKFQELIRRDMDKLAMNITLEQGKTLKGAQGDILRGLEVVENACGMATFQMGEFVPNACNGIDTFCVREPLGVCAGICPFNFPAMTPLSMFPIAVTCGNTFVLKPCEKNPGASTILAALAMESGLPDGVLNIVHGTNDIVNYICDDDDIKAISFISLDMIGLHIQARAASRGKRVQSSIGGKNHAIIMPDASMDETLNALVAAGFGAAGQRSMSLSTAVFVGGSMAWEDELMDRAKALKVNAGTDLSADVGPVISKEVKDHISRLIQSGVDSGARLLLDGRDTVVPGYEKGSFVGPTILCDVTLNMDCYKEEVFGPVLLCMQANSLEEAITIVNKNRHGNGASIFTSSGIAARKFQNDIDAALVGVNVPVPIPVPFSSSHEREASFGGDLSYCGKASAQFYTQIKTVAQQWSLPSTGVSVSMPSFDMEAIQGVSTVPPPQGGSPNERVSRDISLASARDIPKCRELLRQHLPNSGISCLPHVVEGDIPDHRVSLVLPTTAAWDLLESQEMSQAMSKRPESICRPQASTWNGNPPVISQRIEDISVTSQRNFLPMSLRNDNVGSSSKSSDTATALTSERTYKSDDNPLCRRNDSMSPTSRRTDATIHPPSERFYDILAASQLNSANQTFQRSETILSTSEGRYLPASAHRNGHLGSASHRSDIASQPTSERISVTGTSADTMPSSETIYMPAIIQRNSGPRPIPERLSMNLPTSETRKI